jgi:hypothetical protein
MYYILIYLSIMLLHGWPRFLPRKAVIFVDRVSFVQVRGGQPLSPFYLIAKGQMNFNTF